MLPLNFTVFQKSTFWEKPATKPPWAQMRKQTDSPINPGVGIKNCVNGLANCADMFTGLAIHSPTFYKTVPPVAKHCARFTNLWELSVWFCYYCQYPISPSCLTVSHAQKWSYHKVTLPHTNWPVHSYSWQEWLLDPICACRIFYIILKEMFDIGWHWQC